MDQLYARLTVIIVQIRMHGTCIHNMYGSIKHNNILNI